MQSDLEYVHEGSKQGVRFDYDLSELEMDIAESDHLFFAYTYPFTSNDIAMSIDTF